MESYRELREEFLVRKECLISNYTVADNRDGGKIVDNVVNASLP